MALTIPVAHDFICPWCWVGFFQAKRLQQEFGIAIDWVGYELFPDELGWPDYPPADPAPENKPATPTRMEFLLTIEGLEIPAVDRPRKMRTHAPHEAVEYAKTEGAQDAFVEALYRAYWEHGLDLRELSVLRQIATGIVRDVDAMVEAVVCRKFANNIVGFDDAAYAKGVYNVPTFFIGTERFAEQPYVKLEAAVRKLSGI